MFLFKKAFTIFTLLYSLYRIKAIVVAAGLILAGPLLAESESKCDEDSPECVAVGEWDISVGLGFGARSNPLIDGSDLPMFILPEIRYYGERFFFDTYTGGYTFYDGDSQQLNVVATIGFDQIYFKTRSVGNFIVESGPLVASTNNTLTEDDYQLDVEQIAEASDNIVESDFPDSNTPTASLKAPQWREPIDIDQLHSRNTAGLAGLEWSYYSNNWDASVQFLQDFTAVHEGQEIRAALSRSKKMGSNFFELSTGFSWQSAELLQYYYGVDAGEVAEVALEYYTDDGISPFLRIDWRRRFIGNWSWQATLHNRWLSSEIKNSPLLDESSVFTLYLGGVYHF